MHRVCTVVFPVYRCNAFVWLFFLYCRGFKWIVMDDFCRHWSEEVSLSINKLHVNTRKREIGETSRHPADEEIPWRANVRFHFTVRHIIPTAFGRTAERLFRTVSKNQRDSSERCPNDSSDRFSNIKFTHLNVLQMSKWFLRVFSKYHNDPFKRF